MWRNYLTVGLRSLAKNKTYSAIIIGGLAIGMAACLMILMFVRYELSYDRWLPNSENLYQLQTWYPNPSNGDPGFVQMTPYISSKSLKKDFPQIEQEVYVLPSVPVATKDGVASSTEDYMYTDGDLLDVLEFPVVAGDPEALEHPGTIALSEGEAIRRFGSTDVIGKTLSLISKGITTDHRVGVIYKDLPKNSHMAMAAIVRVDMNSYMAQEPNFMTCWGCQNGHVYMKLKAGSDAKAIEAQLPAWEKRAIPDQNAGEARFNAGDEADWHLVNVADVHLGKAQLGAMRPGNDRQSIITFAVIAVLILGMAVVNFTNLATARASQRAREVALRKVLGAHRRQLIIQFVGESVIVAALAMVVALALVELLMPAFARFLDADIATSYLGEGGILPPVLLLVLVVGVVGGLYPAFFLSRFQPAMVLKANKSSAETPGSGRLRNLLVVAQFAVSIGLIICTAVVYAQTVYARTADPGYQRDGIIQVDNLSRYQLINKGEAVTERIKRVEGVTAVGRTGIGVATDNNNNTGIMVPGNPEPVVIGIYPIDEGFFQAMGVKLLAGRNFDPSRPADDATIPFPATPESQQALAARGTNVVMNELAIRRLGFKSPQEAVGKTLRAGLVDNEFGLVPVTIVGVVQDSRFRSVRDQVDPIMFLNTEIGHTFLMARYDGNPAEVRARIEAAWKTITSDVPFEAEFSDDIIQELYEAEDARAKTFAAFALLSVVVGCLGLFGLAAFTAERRTKEIGIRKVLGARTRDIVRLLVWQFSQPVIIANLVAWPVAWWLMRDWLNGFDTRISLNPMLFIGAGLLAMVIAAGTIVGHALKVARANPIHALRYE
ncbi:FtsX-like permease family protein [Sphingoaurantiacus capsulatus]|uniref:FtsX-like permease family protein n=1 Tax=Sphingoaurantiacus capsulatus TaxID=1771310 RepID=A0ABV7X6Y5_9SPHN